MTKLKPDRGMPWCPAYLLEPGETAIWWGRPNLVRYLIRHNVLLGAFVMLCFSAPSGFAIAWLFENATGWLLFGGTLFSVIVAVAFLGMSAWLALDLRNEAKAMTYVLTDRRALIVKPASVFSIAYPSIKFIDLESGSAETGAVLFHEYWVDHADGSSLVREGFIGIANAEAVAREMRRLQAAAS